MNITRFLSVLRMLGLVVAASLWILNLSSQETNSKKQGGRSHGARDHRQLALAFIAQQRWREAEQEYRIYRNEHPDSADAIVWHAETLMRIGQPFDAALELQKFLQQHPNSVRVLELHAVLASSTLHDPNGAETDLEECVKLKPDDFFALKALGDLYLDQGRDNDAIRNYKAAAGIHPKDAIVLASLAYVLSKANASQEAAADFKQALLLAKAPVEVLGVEMLRGRYLLDAGKRDDAIAAFTRVLAVDPASVDALDWRAESYADSQQWPQAEGDALAAMQKSSQDKRAALLLIRIYRQQRDLEKAQKYADIVQRISESEDARFAMGRELRDSLAEVEPLLLKGDYSAAATRYEAIVKTLPTFYEAYFDLGMCYSQTGRLTEAETAFKKYLTFQPVSADGHASLGVVLLEENRGQDAVPELQEAIQIDPTLSEARKALANEYLQESKPEAAVDVLRPAAHEQDEQLLVLLAQALNRTSANGSALEAVNRALALRAEDPQALQLKREILAAQKH